MTNLPEFLAHGEPARLFPIVADASREQRILSIFLAVLAQVPNLSHEILGTVGVRIGKRTRISTFTEVTLKNDVESSGRPDGLLIVATGRATWSALIEAKIGRADLDPSQVERYLNLARENGLDAVITISNDFVARPDHSPVTNSIPRIKQLTKGVKLYHWSWASLATCCEVLAYQGTSESAEQQFLVSELNRYFNYSTTGIERFTQMGPQWKSIVQMIASGAPLARNSPGLEEVVGSWFAEERDLCLHMTSTLGHLVSSRIEKKHINYPKVRLDDGVATLAKTQVLTSSLRIPDCASDITIRADLARRTISVSMMVKARADRKTTKARVNWLLGMLKKDDDRLRIQAYWPGRAAATSEAVNALREEPGRIQADNESLLPHSFEVVLTEDPGGSRFAGTRAFIEDLERIVPDFYMLVGATLKAWQPPPPQPVVLETHFSEGGPIEIETKPDEDTAEAEGPSLG